MYKEGKLWVPSDADRVEAAEGYIVYLLGTNTLQKPDAKVSRDIHGRELDEPYREEITLTAEGLMFDGLSTVIRYTNPPAKNRGLISAELHFVEARPYMRDAVERAFEIGAERITQLENKALITRRPIPLIDEAIYRYFCHGRLYKIESARLMGGLAVHRFFGDTLNGRTLRALAESRKGEATPRDELEKKRAVRQKGT